MNEFGKFKWLEFTISANFYIILKLFSICWAKVLVVHGFRTAFSHKNVKTYCRLFGTISTLCFLCVTYDFHNSLRILPPLTHYILRRFGFIFLVLIFVFLGNLSLSSISFLGQNRCLCVYNVVLGAFCITYFLLLAVNIFRKNSPFDKHNIVDFAMDMIEALMLIVALFISFYTYFKSYETCVKVKNISQDFSDEIFKKWKFFLNSSRIALFFIVISFGRYLVDLYVFF